MKDKEGSGIEKYTESPVTSRSTISEKDMTSVYYISRIYFHFIALKNLGAFMSYDCTDSPKKSVCGGGRLEKI